MTDLGPWTQQDYGSMSWSGAEVHGFALEQFDDEYGAADLVLDIDFVVGSESAGAGALRSIFRRAELRFHRVFGLKMSLDYEAPTAGMCPFSIDGVDREPFPAPRTDYRWRIPVSWPSGCIEFTATGFTQRLVDAPRVQ